VTIRTADIVAGFFMPILAGAVIFAALLGGAWAIFLSGPAKALRLADADAARVVLGIYVFIAVIVLVSFSQYARALMSAEISYLTNGEPQSAPSQPKRHTARAPKVLGSVVDRPYRR
jgi:hypothetical protein